MKIEVSLNDSTEIVEQGVTHMEHNTKDNKEHMCMIHKHIEEYIQIYQQKVDHKMAKIWIRLDYRYFS